MKKKSVLVILLMCFGLSATAIEQKDNREERQKSDPVFTECVKSAESAYLSCNDKCRAYEANSKKRKLCENKCSAQQNESIKKCGQSWEERNS